MPISEIEVLKPSNIDTLDEISKFIFTSKYARYIPEKKRRETWEEAVDRLLKMHLKRYFFLSIEDKDKIKWAFNLVKQKRIAPSMRSLQFGGKAIEVNNARMYNCCVRHIDSIRSFSELFFLLLSGCGIGIGLSAKFLHRLPDLVDETDKNGVVLTYPVLDTIEGWADSIEILLSCYCKNTAFCGRKIVFDYSKIRKEGTPLKTGGGKAPGFKGLKNCHKKIKELLDHLIEYNKQKRLKSIDAYDVLMHCSDAVLSGGVRRSACCVVFDKNDMDMINSKTYNKVDRVYKFTHIKDTIKGNITTGIYEGKIIFEGKKIEITIKDWELEKLEKDKLINWWHVNPQRARSNNSVLLLRSNTTKQEFIDIVEKTKQFGEPGFVWADHEDTLFNPCQPAFAPVITKNGLSTIGDIKIGDEIWSESGWTRVINKWSNGIKEVNKYSTTAGNFISTENHRVVQNGEKIEVKDAESIDLLAGPLANFDNISKQDIMDGLVVGDGMLHGASSNMLLLCIGGKDQDYFNSEIKDLIIKYRPGINEYAYEINTTIQAKELQKTYNRSIPDRFMKNPIKGIGFLRGLFSANGSIVGNRVSLKATSKTIIDQCQLLLSSIGIKSYFTTNQSKIVKFLNGDYRCKQSYDLNISRDKVKFLNLIGFIQGYKTDKLKKLIAEKSTHVGKDSYDIKNIESLGDHEVFDITVDNPTHTYWSSGFNISNCFEISFIPVTNLGECGIQMCNLTTQNGRMITSMDIFRENTEAATIIGTLQAGYTNFHYISNISKSLTEEEALLGCSITGMFDNEDIILNPKNQKEMAILAREVNNEWSKKININSAARINCVKPEGTSSLVLGCASGIHPHHAKKYLRRVQCNRTDNVYKFFKKYNSFLCEESVWSENKTDEVISFPIIAPNNRTKQDLCALDHLKIIKSTQINWILPSANGKKKVNHNVSCTISIDKDEWEEVIGFIFDHREYFTAISMLSKMGDKIYPQSPMESMETSEEIERFNEIINNIKSIEYKDMIEIEDETSHTQEVVCGGGQCEIINI